MAIIGYMRAVNNTHSFEQQEALMISVKPDKVYKDVAAGSNLDRPELRRMLDEINTGDVLHVKSLCRLSRRATDFVAIARTLREKGANLVVHDGSIDTRNGNGWESVLPTSDPLQKLDFMLKYNGQLP